MIKTSVLRYFWKNSGFLTSENRLFLKKSERIFFVKMQKEVDAHHERSQNITFMLEVLCHIVWRCSTLVYI